jgi:Fe-Mn family superoxide dismutase
MRYQIAPLFCRPWTLLGITPRLIESHYENNYGGAFTRLNAISEELEALDPATTPAHVIRRLKQDEAAALNSLALHELYFASLGGDGRAVPEVMANALARDFGSIDRWRREFVALANSLDGGSGWVLLSWLPRAGRLVNQSISDGSQAVAGAITVLALDMYEHAYHLDFGANAVAYVAAFMRNNGFHVGCQTAATLRKAGFDARYMAGGHFAWKAIKGPVKLFESTTRS